MINSSFIQTLRERSNRAASKKPEQYLSELKNNLIEFADDGEYCCEYILHDEERDHTKYIQNWLDTQGFEYKLQSNSFKEQNIFIIYWDENKENIINT